jgi:hypothetical protein
VNRMTQASKQGWDGLAAREDYFRKEVWRFDHMGDYTDPDLRIPVDSYEWNWTMRQFVTAICEAGLRMVFLHEYPQYFYGG